MTPAQVLSLLKQKIPFGTSLNKALTTFISIFDETVIEGCEKVNEGDMLLFQWGGPYSWDPSFSINLTRQFSYESDNREHTGMQQLQMNCRFNPEAITVESGNEWFDGTGV